MIQLRVSECCCDKQRDLCWSWLSLGHEEMEMEVPGCSWIFEYWWCLYFAQKMKRIEMKTGLRRSIRDFQPLCLHSGKILENISKNEDFETNFKFLEFMCQFLLPSGHNPNRKFWQNLWINFVSLNASLARVLCPTSQKLITCNNFASSGGLITSFFSQDFCAAWWAIKKILESSYGN